MVGRTSYSPPTTAMPPNGPEQMADIYEHFDALVGETRPTQTQLPASGNWLNRTIMAEDTGVVYYCTALPGTWRSLPGSNPTGTVSRTSDQENGVDTTPRAVQFTGAPFLRGFSWSSSQPTRLICPPSRVTADAFAIIGSTADGFAWLRANGNDSRPVSSATNNTGAASVRVPPQSFTFTTSGYLELMVQSNVVAKMYSGTVLNADVLTTR